VRLDTRSRAIRRAQPAGARTRLEVRGKFFFAGDEKVPLRGVTYGPFAPDADGYGYPAPEVVERDLALMTELGANCLRLFTPPPRWLLDMASKKNLWFLAWPQVIEGVLRVVPEVGSSHDRANVLLEVVKRARLTGTARQLFIAATDDMSSHDENRVLAALVRAEGRQ